MMKALPAVLGSGSAAAVVVLKPEFTWVLVVAVVGVLSIAAGVIFSASEAPVRRTVLLIRACRPRRNGGREADGGGT